MNKKRMFPLVLLACISKTSWSFTCYLTIAKDSCWTNYHVSVDVMDFSLNKKVLTLDIPKGQSWARQSFDCHESQNLTYIAQFSPVFWENDKGKTYPGLKDVNLPQQISPEATAWTLSVCYPSDFSRVPLPPDADSHCGCDFTSIPELLPQ